MSFFDITGQSALNELNKLRADNARRQAEEKSAQARTGRGLTNPLGSEATGYIPNAPDLGQSSANSIGMNLANMAALKALYSGVADSYVPGYGGLAETESANIQDLLNPGRLIDAERYGAEAASMRGVSGSPAGISSAVKRTDDEILRRKLLGSQLLGGAAQRGKGIMPFENFFTTPNQAFEADWLKNQLAAAPNPAAAYDLNMANAQIGLINGQRAGYGGGGGRSTLPQAGGGNMITGSSSNASSRVDDVVRRYSSNLSPTMAPPANPNGYGELTGPNGTTRIDNQGNFSWPNAQPLPDWSSPDWTPPANNAPNYFDEGGMEYDWAN
jgi:hypothetical protein